MSFHDFKSILPGMRVRCILGYPNDVATVESSDDQLKMIRLKWDVPNRINVFHSPSALELAITNFSSITSVGELEEAMRQKKDIMYIKDPGTVSEFGCTAIVTWVSAQHFEMKWRHDQTYHTFPLEHKHYFQVVDALVQTPALVQEAPCSTCQRMNDVGIRTCWYCGNSPTM